MAHVAWSARRSRWCGGPGGGGGGGGADRPARWPGRQTLSECLLRPPQPDTLHVARAGARAGRQLRLARTTHRLEPWEELIAVWQWARVLGMIATAPGSLIFTSQGIRIAEPRLRLSISYDLFREHTFT